MALVYSSIEFDVDIFDNRPLSCESEDARSLVLLLFFNLLTTFT